MNVAAIGLTSALVALVGIVLAYFYDRGRRYNYLADRWNALMMMNTDEPDFFEANKTIGYKRFARAKKNKYCQHARVYWGAVEDIVRNDYHFEQWLGIERFVDAYSDTIIDCIDVHHTWLRENKETLFNYRKFRQELPRKFQHKLSAVSLDLNRT